MYYRIRLLGSHLDMGLMVRRSEAVLGPLDAFALLLEMLLRQRTTVMMTATVRMRPPRIPERITRRGIEAGRE